MTKRKITVEEVKRLWVYDAQTGILRWREGPMAGQIAGKKHVAGYLFVCAVGTQTLVHRIAWVLQTGCWPTGVVDHINGTKDDNRWANLRDVGPRENAWNKERHRRGWLAGTSYEKSRAKWRAVAQINGKMVFIGRFDTAIDAHAAYKAVVGQ